jgi:hypothetical protein
MNKQEQQLDAMLHLAEVQARQILLKLHKPSLVPIWVMFTAEGKVDLLPTPWADEHEKQLYANMVRILMRKRSVDRCTQPGRIRPGNRPPA